MLSRAGLSSQIIAVEVIGYRLLSLLHFQLFFRLHSFYDFDGAPRLFIESCVLNLIFLRKIYKEELVLQCTAFEFQNVFRL